MYTSKKGSQSPRKFCGSARHRLSNCLIKFQSCFPICVTLYVDVSPPSQRNATPPPPLYLFPEIDFWNSVAERHVPCFANRSPLQSISLRVAESELAQSVTVAQGSVTSDPARSANWKTRDKNWTVWRVYS